MKLGYRIDKHFKRYNTYRTVGGVIIRGGGHKPDSRISIGEIDSWLISGNKWNPQITLYISDGRQVDLPDKHKELRAILERHLPNATI